MNNNQEKSSYKETGDKVTSTLGAISAGLESTAKEVSKNLDISNLGKTIIKIIMLLVSLILLSNIVR